MNDLMIQQEGFAGRCQKVLQVAQQLYQTKPDWVTFFRETLGVNGSARSVFPMQEEYVQFEQSREFSEIQKMVAGLRTRKAGSGKNEPTRVITVRLPESLHEALKAEANDHNTSMNKLCISKLLQVLVEDEKAQAQSQQNLAQPIRSTAPPAPVMAPAPAQTAPSQMAQQQSQMTPAQPPQTPNFRSTYGQQPSQPQPNQQPPNNMTQTRRFGQ